MTTCRGSLESIRQVIPDILDPPIILRVEQVLVDLRTVFPSQDSQLIGSLQKAVAKKSDAG